MTYLKISIDPDSSVTKVAYQVKGGEVKCFSMCPHCAEVPLSGAAANFWTGFRRGVGKLKPFE